MTKKGRKHTAKGKAAPSEKSGVFHEDKNRTVSVYSGFARWKDRAAPKWHPVKKMRYVFFRMIAGITITDALREIRWSPSEFWHMIDLKAETPFHAEYVRAKKLQGRALGDATVVIAEGRDAVSRIEKKRMKKIVDRVTRKMSRTKSKFARKVLMQQLLGDLREIDKIVMGRNKLQIESVKWLAEKVNPAEFSQKSTLAVGSPDGQGSAEARPIAVQFVGPDGKVVKL